MFKIARNVSTTEEHFKFEIGEVVRGHYDTEEKKHIYSKISDLHISVYGKIDEHEYCLHFIPRIPIEQYFDIPKYESLKFTENEMDENYIMIDGIAYLDLKIDLKVLRYNETLIFTLTFRDCDAEFYGDAEIEIELEELRKRIDAQK